jgi:hypothetical protein
VQLLAPAHSLSGSVPGATAPQEPFDPPPFFAALHAWHRPEQGRLQQNPSTQLPLEHSAPVAHVVPFTPTQAPALQNRSPGHSLSGSIPVVMGAHVPLATVPVLPVLHPMQLPVHAVLQQTPSTQKPLMQPVVTVHTDPSGAAHPPAPLQTPAPWHSLSGSNPKPTSPQTPFAPLPFFWALHARHEPVHDVSQQNPSTQNPLWQLAFAAHAAPLGLTQVPLPLQTAVPAHSLSGSVPPEMFPQVPSDPVPFFAALHAWQRPVHEVSQHTPSRHEPLWHSVLLTHAVPMGLMQAPTPLHVPVPGHSLSGSRPFPMTPQEPSEPLPFFAAVHAWHVPVHAELQHTPSAQLALWQSPPAAQCLAIPQAGQVPPPQSMSVSAPFLTPSLQSGARHMWVADEQTRLAQSGPIWQCRPAAHAGQDPPQSVSVSDPSWTPFAQGETPHRSPEQIAL